MRSTNALQQTASCDMHVLGPAISLADLVHSQCCTAQGFPWGHLQEKPQTGFLKDLCLGCCCYGYGLLMGPSNSSLT